MFFPSQYKKSAKKQFFVIALGGFVLTPTFVSLADDGTKRIPATAATQKKNVALVVNVTAGKKKSPVKGATVLINFEASPNLVEKTGNDGAAVFPNAKEGDCRLTVISSGNLIFSRKTSITPGKALDIGVGDNVCDGSVVGNTGGLLAGVRVTLAPADGSLFFSTVTKPDGKFQFINVPEGAFKLVASDIKQKLVTGQDVQIPSSDRTLSVELKGN